MMEDLNPRIDLGIENIFKPMTKQTFKKLFSDCTLNNEQRIIWFRGLMYARVEEDWKIFLAKVKLRFYK